MEDIFGVLVSSSGMKTVLRAMKWLYRAISWAKNSFMGRTSTMFAIVIIAPCQIQPTILQIKFKEAYCIDDR